jgi:hypothetical protein
MAILLETPPIYARILDAFPLAKKRGVIFSWGENIYNPSGVDIPDHLIIHERLHSRRQNGDPRGWWDKYLEDSEFRLNEEILAHIAELSYVKDHAPSRELRRGAAGAVALRLRNPLYGWKMTKKEARAHLKAI